MLPSAPNAQTRRRHRASKTSNSRLPLGSKSNGESTTNEAKYEHRTRAAIRRTPMKGRIRRLKNGTTSFVPSPTKRSHAMLEGDTSSRASASKSKAKAKAKIKAKASAKVAAKALDHPSLSDIDDYETPQCGLGGLTAIALMKSMVQTWISRFSASMQRSRAQTQGDYGTGTSHMAANAAVASNGVVNQTPTRPKISIAARQALQMQVFGAAGKPGSAAGGMGGGDYIEVSAMQVSPSQLSRLPPGQYTVNNVDALIDTLEQIQGLKPGTSMERKKHDMVAQMKNTIAARALHKEQMLEEVVQRASPASTNRKASPATGRQKSKGRRRSLDQNRRISSDSTGSTGGMFSSPSLARSSAGSAAFELLFQDFFEDSKKPAISTTATTEADLRELFPVLQPMDATANPKSPSVFVPTGNNASTTAKLSLPQPVPVPQAGNSVQQSAPPAPPPPPFAMMTPAAPGGAVPPPPPPMGLGGFPPPPPPPPAGMLVPGGGAGGSARKRALRGSMHQPTGPRLRKLHWEPLQENHEVEGTLWARAEELTGRIAPALGTDTGSGSHLQRLHDLFGEQRGRLPDGSSPKKRMRRKSQRPSDSASSMDRGTGASNKNGDQMQSSGVLDSQRSQNIAIGLYQFKKQGGVTFIISTLRTMNHTALNLGQIEGLRDTLLPDAKEATAASQYLASHPDFSIETFASRLPAAEVFVLGVAAVPSYRLRVNALHSRHTLEELIHSLDAQIQLVHSACAQLQQSEPLHSLLTTILAVGNALNRGTTKGQARGFSMAALGKVANTKAVDGSSTTLLDYIAHVFIDSTSTGDAKRSDDFLLAKEIPSVKKAKRVDLAFTASQTRQIVARVSELRSLVTMMQEEAKNAATPKKSNNTSPNKGLNGSPFVDAIGSASKPQSESWADFSARMEVAATACRARYEKLEATCREFMVFFGVTKKNQSKSSSVVSSTT